MGGNCAMVHSATGALCSLNHPLPMKRAPWFCRALCGALLASASFVPGYGQSPQVLTHDGGHDDRGNAVATDASGALFVGGSSNTDATPVQSIVLKYNAAGTLLWQARPAVAGDYTPNTIASLATDAAGNVYAAGHAFKTLPFMQREYGGLVSSFAANGTPRWNNLFNGAGNSFDLAQVITADAQGVYVAGITSGSNGRPDWLVIKYSLAGVELWRNTEAGSYDTDDQPVAIKTDAAGNVLVLGWVGTNGVSGPKDLRLVKYSPQGALLWRSDYSDTAISDEAPTALVVDAAGNSYATADRGFSTNPELSFTPITVKFDDAGNRVFVLAGPGRGGSAIALDGAGNFVVSGFSNDDAGTNLTAQTSKFTAAGALLWTRTSLAGGQLGVDTLTGNIFVNRNASYTVAKLNSAGQILWEQTVPNGQIVQDGLLDPATGDFVLTGNSATSNGNILTARFSAISAPPPPPPGPAAPSALSTSAKKGAVTLNWTDNANNETGFRIERATGSGAFVEIATVGANVRTYNSSGLTKNVTYSFRVRAYNANGSSAYSNTATGVPK